MDLGNWAEDGEAVLRAAFDGLRAAAQAQPYPDVRARSDALQRLGALIESHAPEFAAAIAADFGARSTHETHMLEVYPSLVGIRHARRHLRRWMRRRRAGVSPWFLPARAYVMPQPLGLVGIVAPWNYPLFLTMAPLAAALAAGNRALIKPSELAPRTATLLREAIGQRFAQDEVAVVEGDARVAAAFCALPFDHLLFTGSTAVGRQVMHAAADNLTPVTLELGGKSPVLIAPDYSIERAAQRIMVGKCLNAGQTCIAPDYVLLPRGREEAFVSAARAAVDRMYPHMAQTPDYSHIINARHYFRLAQWLADAQAHGARALTLSSSLATADAERRRMPPTALLGAPDGALVMQQEIFGPLLPLRGYDRWEEALEFVRARPRPLAMYVFDDDRARVDALLAATAAGGVTINDTLWHVAQEDLPFGGVGASGMGAYHGRAGFDAMSKLKPVFVQSELSGVRLFRPPFGRRFERLLGLLLRSPW